MSIIAIHLQSPCHTRLHFQCEIKPWRDHKEKINEKKEREEKKQGIQQEMRKEITKEQRKERIYKGRKERNQ